jgi:hypothetical protein
MVSCPERNEVMLTNVEVDDLAIKRLGHLVRRSHIPAAIRRRGKAFDGATAYEWIEDGRIDEVVAQYEKVLKYQA